MSHRRSVLSTLPARKRLPSADTARHRIPGWVVVTAAPALPMTAVLTATAGPFAPAGAVGVFAAGYVRISFPFSPVRRRTTPSMPDVCAHLLSGRYQPHC